MYRSWKLPTYTIGRLFLDCEFFCNTLEDAVRDLRDLNADDDFADAGEGKVYGETAIPAGTYMITLEHSPKFQRRLPTIHDVKGFSYIRIHAGNSAADTDGCILVGENKIRGRLINSRAWENLLTQKIDEAIKRGEDVKITIYNT